MSQTRQNKMVTITNDEVYDLATHQARMADSANVVIPVNSQAERDALTKFTGMAVARLDLNGQLELWDGAVWQRTSTSVAPTAGAGWALTGSLVRTRATLNTQISAAFKAVYSGGTFSVGTNWVQVFTLTNAGYIPVTNDAYGYFMLRNSAAAGRLVKGELAFTIDPTGAVYVRTMFGQAATNIAAGDELPFNAVWNA